MNIKEVDEMKYYNMGREITEAEFKEIAKTNKAIFEAVEQGAKPFEALQQCIFVVVIDD